MTKATPDKLYHGSPRKFIQFDIRHIGSNVGTTGASVGFYFTTSLEEAVSYGKYVYVVDFKRLKLQKSLSNYVKTLSGDQIIKLLDLIMIMSKGTNNFYDNYEDYHYEDYIANEKITDKRNAEKEIVSSFLSITDTDMLGNLVNAGIEEKYIFDALHKLGYNYTMDQCDGSNFRNSQHYILYFAPKILSKLMFKNEQAFKDYNNKLKK